MLTLYKFARTNYISSYSGIPFYYLKLFSGPVSSNICIRSQKHTNSKEAASHKPAFIASVETIFTWSVCSHRILRQNNGGSKIWVFMWPVITKIHRPSFLSIWTTSSSAFFSYPWMIPRRHFPKMFVKPSVTEILYH